MQDYINKKPKPKIYKCWDCSAILENPNIPYCLKCSEKHESNILNNTLASDLSEQANNAPSDFVACESGVNPPPVAVSSYPAASDTPYKNMQSQRLGAAL